MPDTKEILRTKFEYVRWADLRIVEAAAALSEEGFYRDQHISHGSVHKLLVHCMGSQCLWRGRWVGLDLPFFKSEDYPTLQHIQDRWPGIHDDLFAFIDAQSEESLSSTLHYKRFGQPYTGVLWHLLTHVADHATYHRGQLNSMIKLAGGKPCDPSFITYSRERTGQPV